MRRRPFPVSLQAAFARLVNKDDRLGSLSNTVQNMNIDLVKTMKAIRFYTYGGTEVLQMEDVPVPSVQAGELLIRVYAARVNSGDWQDPFRICSQKIRNRRPAYLH